jgi:O-antigen/teichoic acid export membrane protein
MSVIANRTAILTLSRLANYGLMLISPVLLVRLLTVEEFGRYREFLLYASILQALAIFSINDSVLYCLPANPLSPWRIARQTVALTFVTSVLVVLALAVVDLASGGAVVGAYLVPLAFYTLLSVNFDFWEFFWLARGRPGAVFVYSASRLLARIAVAVGVAALTHDVRAVIWGLVVLEGLRLIVATGAFLRLDQSRREPPLAEPWRDQVRFALPSGLASLLAMVTRNVSNVAVAKLLGPVALAQYAIGRFGEPVVVAVRNSLSCVVLPEMVRRDRQDGGKPLALWQRATVINALFLFPVAVFVARYAEPLIVTVFGPQYAQAALIMQIYMLVVIRECFDFAPALRAINKTRPLVESNVAALLTCGIALLALIPLWGVGGAMAAFALGSFVDVSWLGWRTHRLYATRRGELMPWMGVGKVAVAALLAGGVLVSVDWVGLLGFAGILLAGCAYLVAFAVLVLVMRVAEAGALLVWAKRLLLRRTSAVWPGRI